jgi:hypothetical protein
MMVSTKPIDFGPVCNPAGFTAEVPSNYLMTGAYPSNNAWSAQEDIDQNPPSPQFKAIQLYN